MGGGKSRALCEETFDWMLEYPGIVVPLFRQTHTSLTLSTRRTFLEQVLPAELRGRDDLVRIVNSGGNDYVELKWLGSQVHFVGLDNPGKWFSTEIGAAGFDEAHEISEKDVLIINSRLRQRCNRCVRAGAAECEHMPHRMIFTFNPSYPGHWLQQWFILGASQTEHGYHKDELFATEAEFPIGDSDFFISKATDNPYLPERYIKRTLAGFGKQERRRYLDGLWEHIGGGSFFDGEALAEQSLAAMEFDSYQYLRPRPYEDPAAKTTLTVRTLQVDSASIAKFGPWPWPAATLAELTDKLKAQGAAIVVLAFALDKPDSASPLRIAASLPPGPGTDLARTALLKLPSPDDALVRRSPGRSVTVEAPWSSAVSPYHCMSIKEPAALSQVPEPAAEKVAVGAAKPVPPTATGTAPRSVRCRCSIAMPEPSSTPRSPVWTRSMRSS